MASLEIRFPTHFDRVMTCHELFMSRQTVDRRRTVIQYIVNTLQYHAIVRLTTGFRKNQLDGLK